ncbi:hypothetical protein AAFF_G00140820 [Aldrovandia affinis]|uniref:Uncharacterized protein n=1 Tax=Aldrovandia affinis TaxID=143900 RepID=A0AAD7TCQ5_9TELE|nr:hypothetical protein AAFF_G00140820 [Aldrovandia affinis]
MRACTRNSNAFGEGNYPLCDPDKRKPLCGTNSPSVGLVCPPSLRNDAGGSCTPSSNNGALDLQRAKCVSQTRPRHAVLPITAKLFAYVWRWPGFTAVPQVTSIPISARRSESLRGRASR